ncbi:alpha/beta fold hydrolase [Nonlabens marinus]|uniref:Aspartokinase n=1 Tax=Nonlabens marinus S1-08 TaxID=1454201 RepID=W8VNE3_9FLAO|nr:alpha/beta fold hydrolase [Nonlabens marinus]BAO54404.1 aspartokinase [Nonlabens marinus S1-08]
MSEKLNHIAIPDLLLQSGKKQSIQVSYQTFGRELHSAPIVLVNHALTGNSNVPSWWGALVGDGETIDLNQVTVLAFDIPGNGYDGITDHLIYNYQEWCLGDVAFAFAKAIQTLNIQHIDIGIGGSIGGALLWELLAIQPKLFGTIIPIAADWKSTDWLIACCHVQEQILKYSEKPIETARQHAMTFYRAPQGLKEKFKREKLANEFKVNQWLDHHGKVLEARFSLPSYRLLNHLLWNIDAAASFEGNIEKILKRSDTIIEMIAIDSDGFFLAAEDRETFDLLRDQHPVRYHEIQSLHGHDAFLIEHDQVAQILKDIFRRNLQSDPSTRLDQVTN